MNKIKYTGSFTFTIDDDEDVEMMCKLCDVESHRSSQKNDYGENVSTGNIEPLYINGKPFIVVDK